MKSMIYLPFVALAAFVIGSWGPSADLRQLKDAARDEQSDRGKKRSAKKNSGLGTIAQMVHIPDEPPERPASTNDTPEEVPFSPPEAQSASAVTNAAACANDEDGDKRRARKVALEWIGVRADIAKTQWKTKLNLSESDCTTFDGVVDEMNAALRETMDALVATVSAEGKVTNEMIVHLMSEMTTALANAYDGLAAALPQADREQLSEIPVYDLVSPWAIEPLFDAEEMLGEDIFKSRHTEVEE